MRFTWLVLLSSCSTLGLPQSNFDTSNLYLDKRYKEQYHSCKDIEAHPPVRADNQTMCNCNGQGFINARN